MALEFNKKQNTRITRAMKGTSQDLLKERADSTDGILDEVQKFFKEYAGGSVAIVMNTYDENAEVTGANVAILGVDDFKGLISLAEHLEKAKEEINDNLMKNIVKSALSDNPEIEKMMRKFFTEED